MSFAPAAWIAPAVFLLGMVLYACGASRTPGANEPPPQVLAESWKTYAARFIQADGRVIDHQAGGISTSEGQAYAMLRAVWMDDRTIFDKTHTWSVNNLNTGIRQDHLWAWKWGKAPDGQWRVLDRAFATDADQDAVLALILASIRWNEPKYLHEAQAVLPDLWRLGTIQVRNRRFLLAGDTLCSGKICRINPSYFAPYAYRIFHTVDPSRDWEDLVDSSYQTLGNASHLTATRLPPDWLQLDTSTGVTSLGNAKDSAFSYDAIRVFWRIALDFELFHEPRAEAFLKRSLGWVGDEWGRAGKLPAVVSSTGRPEAAYESLEMLAALMPALRAHAPDLAGAFNGKLQATYSKGAWADRNSYYLQNWAWFGTALYRRYLAPFRGAVR